MENEIMKRALLHGLRGHPAYAHVDPLKAVNGLSPKETLTIPSGGQRSILEILYHIVYWQDLAIKAMEGEIINWNETGKNAWLSKKAAHEDIQWDDLSQKFSEGIHKVEQIIMKRNLSERLAGWKNEPLTDLLMIEIIHNSYHIGQIVLIRSLLNLWPG
ncbi:MAG: DinB family protein [Candidatus Thorarchaeota archaeon]|jgi:uncharacterized damage-inducible protein DinB